MRPILILSALLMFSYGNAQKKRISKFDAFLPSNIELNEGTIYLNDGKELNGLVAYNDLTGVLKFEKGNDSRSLTSRSVMAFEVYDPTIDENRIYYSLPGEDPENGSTRPFFFELIQDFKSFAVLSRKEPMRAKEKKGIRTNNYDSKGRISSTDVWSNDQVIVQQVETIYFLRPQEDPRPYFSIIVETSSKKSILFDGQKTKEKFLEKDLLEEFLGELLPKVDQYAKENRLSFKDKSDFLKILEYYESLIN